MTKRLFLGVFSEEKKEIKLVPTSDIISVSQTVKGFEPTVVAKDDVICFDSCITNRIWTI